MLKRSTAEEKLKDGKCSGHEGLNFPLGVNSFIKANIATHKSRG
jgi:hypothetical protein